MASESKKNQEIWQLKRNFSVSIDAVLKQNDLTNAIDMIVIAAKNYGALRALGETAPRYGDEIDKAREHIEKIIREVVRRVEALRGRLPLEGPRRTPK